jgi:hypothetical protein
MYPQNNIYLNSGLGGFDAPLTSETLDNQIRQLNAYRERLNELQRASVPNGIKNSPVSLWNTLDEELRSMDQETLSRITNDSKYIQSYAKIQELVQVELLNLVRGKIEASEEGKKLLSDHLSLTKELRQDIEKDTKKEMELFMQFKEYSKKNPSATYEEFLKTL